MSAQTIINAMNLTEKSTMHNPVNVCLSRQCINNVQLAAWQAKLNLQRMFDDNVAQHYRSGSSECLADMMEITYFGIVTRAFISILEHDHEEKLANDILREARAVTIYAVGNAYHVTAPANVWRIVGEMLHFWSCSTFPKNIANGAETLQRIASFTK